MNFLRQSFSSIAEPPSSNPPPPLQNLPSDRDRDRDGALQAAAAVASVPLPSSLAAPVQAAQLPASIDSDGEDARLFPVPSASAVDSLRTRNRVAIEDHVDVPKDGGGILIPSRELPPSWYTKGNMHSILSMDRDFLFPGECVSIVVYVSCYDSSMPQIITPFRVAAMLERVNQNKKETTKEDSLSVSEDSLKASLEQAAQPFTAEKVESSSSLENGSVAAEKVVMIEEHKHQSTASLNLFQKSHFFTRILGVEEHISKGDKLFGQPAEELDDGTLSTSSSENKRSTESAEPVPFVIEAADFDPGTAGGVARNAQCFSFDNGDIAVLLQVSVSTNLKGEVILEVLQFEQPGQLGTLVSNGNQIGKTQGHERHITSSDQLLQWLLPLDNPLSLPTPGMAATSTPFVNSSQQRPSTSSSASSLFSFASLRKYSSGSSSQSSQSSSTATSQLSSTYGLEEWDRSMSQRSAKGHAMEKEGLLSFRGAQLEPQRFSVRCGLEGLYVPGWRWRRKLEIVEPVAIESYVADCNARDLICVNVENIVPHHVQDITVTIDSISIVCQSPYSRSVASLVPIACVEVGEYHKLPGLSLRRGEQHSFILKPSNSSTSLFNDKVEATLVSNSHETQAMKQTNYSAVGTGRSNVKDHGLTTLQNTSSYAVVVSCRCSHTESRLHFKHPIKWQPRTPRDLLLSVSLESISKPELSTSSLPTFIPKVVTVQATNLTSNALHLTLLAPSSKGSGTSLPKPISSTEGLPRVSSYRSFHDKEWPSSKRKDENDPEQENINSQTSPSGRPNSLQRSLSLPPAKPIESIMGITPRVVKERAISAADIAAENNSTRTHLWLQSIIPLGYIPPKSSTSIRCELLPLTDGVITLDTLHISTKEQDVYYPEQPLQIHATSSIGIGIPQLPK